MKRLLLHASRKPPDYEREIRLFYDHVGETIRTYPYTVRWIRSLEKKWISYLYII